jgi:hypothetical protein
VFVGLRLTLLLAYTPMLVDGSERGITTFGDFQHYYNLASLSQQGLLPYRDYWYEFPPIFPLISLAVYSVTGSAGFTAYAVLLALVMLAFDVGNLRLVQRIAAALHSEATGVALGWIYALLAVPLVFAHWTFEPVVAFCILLTLAWLIEGRDPQAAVAIALGALTKFIPLVLLAVVWRYRVPRVALSASGLAALIVAVGLALVLIIGGRFGPPSLLAQFSKASYQTVWALIDGNYKTGNFGPIADHFDPQKAALPVGNPAVIPWWLRGLVFGGIGLFIYVTTRRFDNLGLVAFASVTISVSFLWSQGWSPQWMVILLPLILLNFPTRSGVLMCLLLSIGSFIEYPLLFSRTGDTGGAISGAQIPIFSALVWLRTVALIGLSVGLTQILRVEAKQP